MIPFGELSVGSKFKFVPREDAFPIEKSLCNNRVYIKTGDRTYQNASTGTKCTIGRKSAAVEPIKE